MPELVTIAGVPILRTGTYALMSGERTFAEEDLVAAAQALQTDQGVKPPRVKLEGLDHLFDPLAHGGPPAAGWVDNLTVVNAGQELVGDFHVPQWVADAMEWAYPSLSIEGTPPGWTSATGRAHDLVITAVQMLGVDWPGVTTLDDLPALLANGPDLAVVEEDAVLARTPTRQRREGGVTASLDADLVVRRFLERLDEGAFDLPDGVESAWDIWPRTSRFDDDGNPYLKVTDEGSGRLYRVDFTVQGNDVTFGEFVEVVEQDVPVAAAAAAQVTAARSPQQRWNTREQARAVLAAGNVPAPRAGNDETEDRHMPDLNLAAARQLLGLPDDADETAVNTALEAAAGAAANANTDDVTDPPEGAPAVTVPAGMVLMDEASLAELQQGVAAGVAARAEQQRAARDATITAAIREGRIPVARRAHYEGAWETDPEGTRTLLTADVTAGGLARGLVPVTAAVGADGDGEDVDANVDEQHEAYMDRHFPQVAARRAGGGERARIRTEA